MRKNLKDTELSKEHILAAAENVFGRNGYAGANMDEIARMTGMTKGAIFWHYGSKLGLFKAVLEKSVHKVRELIEQAFATEENIMDQCQKVVLAIQRDLAFKVMLQMGSLDGERGIPKNALNKVNQEIASIFRELYQKMETARKRGEIKADTNITEILMSLVLFMAGFALIDKITKIFMISQSPDGEATIPVIFKGLNSFRK